MKLNITSVVSVFSCFSQSRKLKLCFPLQHVPHAPALNRRAEVCNESDLNTKPEPRFNGPTSDSLIISFRWMEAAFERDYKWSMDCIYAALL